MSTHAFLAEPTDEGLWRGRWVHFDGYPSCTGEALFQAHRELGDVESLRRYAIKDETVQGHWTSFMEPSFQKDFDELPLYIRCEYCRKWSTEKRASRGPCPTCDGTRKRFNPAACKGWIPSDSPLIVEDSVEWDQYEWEWLYVIADTALLVYDQWLTPLMESHWDEEPDWSHIDVLTAAVSRTVEELDLFYPELLEEVLEQLDQLDSDERQLAISLMDDHNPLDAIAGVRVAALPAR